MKLSALLKDTTVLQLCAPAELEVQGICCDSRKAVPGCLFVAVSGFAVDGHQFIPAACAAGAAVVVCERPPEAEIPYVLVESARQALAELSAAWYCYPTREMKVVGVTGTNGKTTVTCILKQILEYCGAKVGLIGTIQNMIGSEVLPTERTTPESLELQQLFRRMADAGCTHVVMEVSSHALALHRVDCVDFDTGVFTNLTQDHLDFHKTMQAYGEAKALLFSRCRDGVLNADDPAWELMARHATCRVLTTSAHHEADLCARNAELLPDGIRMQVVCGAESAEMQLGIPGDFNVYNVLSAIGAAHTLGFPLEEIARALKCAKGVKGRVEVVPTPGTDYTVIIDYAHTPDGLENILRTVRGFCRGRLIVLFGCGGDRDALKRPIMGEIAAKLADLAVVTSDNPRTEAPEKIIGDILAGMQDTKTPYTVIENRREAIAWAMAQAQKDDVLVLAGKGHETYQIIGTEKTQLDEREVVADVLRRLKKEQTT